MKKTIYTLLLLLFVSPVFCQTDLVYVDDLSYHSGFEEWAVRNHFLKGNISEFLLYCASDKDFTEAEAKKLENEFNVLITNLETQLEKLKKPKHKTNLIFETIHNKYLVRYRPNVNFHALFSIGEFNCLTASCLYAIAFQKLNIPYEIVLAPGHVYLNVYPGEYNFIVETTNPVKGVYQFDEKKFENYKKRLLEYKMITEEEYDRLTIKDFQYRQDSTVNNYSLTSYLYNNQLYANPEPSKEQAFSLVQKVYLFNPIEHNKEKLDSKSTSYAYESGFNENQYKTVLMYGRLADSAGLSTAKFHFLLITEDVDNSNFEKYKRNVYLNLKNHWPDSNLHLLDSVIPIFYHTQGYFYEKKGDYKKAYENYFKLYQLDKQDKYIPWFTYNLARHYVDLELIYGELKKLKDSLPELMKNDEFYFQYYYSLVNIAPYYLTKGKLDKAKIARAEFETDYVNKNRRLHDHISQAYVVIASYYFRKGNKKEAKKAISKGLEFVPYDMKLTKLQFALD